jgi:hypothetical protein
MTPQTFIAGQRVGGYDDLLRFFGKSVPDPKATSYTPVIALFSITALMALAASISAYGTPFTIRAGEWFIAFSMCVLARRSRPPAIWSGGSAPTARSRWTATPTRCRGG